VTDVAESDVYETEETETKAEVDEDRKETRLQGLKDQIEERFRSASDSRDQVEEPIADRGTVSWSSRIVTPSRSDR